MAAEKSLVDCLQLSREAELFIGQIPMHAVIFSLWL